MLIPLGIAAVSGVAFWKMLDRMRTGKFDPHAIDNPIVGKPFPAFALQGFGGTKGFAAADLKVAVVEKPVLVNFYASWCIPCAAEADVLAALAGEGIPIWGIAYKDKPDASDKFLNRYGNPYARIADDAAGRVAIDWGVYGVPESFLIDRNGIVTWHLAGPLSEDSVRDELRPALKAASA